MGSALELLHLAAGCILALTAWLVPRHVAGERRAALHVLLLDAAPVALGAGLLALAAGRPIFAGIIALALGAGFALADDTMRQTLREPAVFSGIGRAAAGLHPPASLPALRRPRTGAGGSCGGRGAGPGIAGFRAAAVDAAAARRTGRRGADRRRVLAFRPRAAAGGCGRHLPAAPRAASRSRTPPPSARTRRCSCMP